MYDWEAVSTAYKAADQKQKGLFDSTLIPTCVHSLVNSRHLDKAQYRDVVRLYGLFILGALDEDALINEFRNLGIPNGRVIFYNLQTCKENTPPTKHSDLDSDIEETEEALKASVTEPASDPPTITKQEEVVYSSTQSAILKERSQPSPTTIPPVGDTRWENSSGSEAGDR